jgi:hypothetical protein
VRRPRKRFDNPLQQYWATLVKRRLTVVACFLAAVLLTGLYNMSLEPLYQSQARILIEDMTRYTSIQDGTRLSADWYMTQFEILKSAPIIAKVVQKLELTNHYWSNPGPLETLRAKVLGRSPGRRPAGPNPAALVPLIQRSVSISPETSSGLVAVRVIASDAKLARDINNALVDTFIEENLQAKLQISFAASEYLTRGAEGARGLRARAGDRGLPGRNAARRAAAAGVRRQVHGGPLGALGARGEAQGAREGGPGQRLLRHHQLLPRGDRARR